MVTEKHIFLISFCVLLCNFVNSQDQCEKFVLPQHWNEEQVKKTIINLYDEKVQNSEALIRMVDKLESVEHRLFGYRCIFENMLAADKKYKSNELDNFSTIAIAHRIHQLRKDHTKNEHMTFIWDNLPAAIKTFPFHAKNIKIKSKHFREYMYTNSHRSLVVNRHFALTYKPDTSCEFASCEYELQMSDDNFGYKICNPITEEYLYLSPKRYDSKRRYALTSLQTTIENYGDIWQFVPVRNSTSYLIRNVQWDEYLYPGISDTYKFDSERRHIFSYVPKGCEKEFWCEWTVSN